jgi:cyclohexanone monooxygenase
LQYSYVFSDELRHEWQWTERYASQPEILRYLNYVAKKFDLYKDIQFESRVTAAVFDETLSRWNIQTNRGDHVSAKFCIMATGCLSKARTPDFKGLDTFKGNTYHTSRWPHTDVNFNDCRVAVIGTGSSALQSIPIIAEQAAHLYVFQRTPCFTIPGYNAALDPKYSEAFVASHDENPRPGLGKVAGIEVEGIHHDKPALSFTPEHRQQVYDERYQIGGLTFLAAFNDLLISKEANDTAAEFLRSKIRKIIKDPATAETLTPYGYPIGSKRMCVDNQYYETYNRDNVTLVDLRKENIEEITPVGIKTTKMTYEVDSIVFATGFDAMTGPLLSIDIRGRSNYSLREKWAAGPHTYLGLMTADFPNLFLITGPGSPSVLTNMVISIEHDVDWIAECLDYLRKYDFDSIEATLEAEDAWVNHVNEIANATLFPSANSWYIGANIPGKPRVFMPYAGGLLPYLQKCKSVATNGYEGFRCIQRQLVTSSTAN